MGHALDVIIAGGSAAGLFAGLLLARAGHQVLVLERDCLQPAPDVESAAAAARRSTQSTVDRLVIIRVSRSSPGQSAVSDSESGICVRSGASTAPAASSPAYTSGRCSMRS